MSGTHWWEPNKKSEKIYEGLAPLVKKIREEQSYRHVDNLRNLKLYGNFDAVGVGPLQYSKSSSPDSNDVGVTSKVTLNVIQSCVDTAASKIAKNAQFSFCWKCLTYGPPEFARLPGGVPRPGV